MQRPREVFQYLNPWKKKQISPRTEYTKLARVTKYMGQKMQHMATPTAWCPKKSPKVFQKVKKSTVENISPIFPNLLGGSSPYPLFPSFKICTPDSFPSELLLSSDLSLSVDKLSDFPFSSFSSTSPESLSTVSSRFCGLFLSLSFCLKASPPWQQTMIILTKAQNSTWMPIMMKSAMRLLLITGSLGRKQLQKLKYQVISNSNIIKQNNGTQSPIPGLQLIICNNLNFMKVIREIPVSKTHSVPLCSLSCLCILFMALVTLLIPFFLVFTEGFFRNSSQVYEQFAINSTYQYYVSATSSLTSASFSNLVSDNIVNSDLLISNVKMSQQDTNTDSKNDVFTFEATITQPINKVGSITSITVLLFFKAVSSSVSTTAMAMYNFKGSSISSAVSTGHLQLVQNQIINTTSNNTDYTSNPFVSNYYNLEATFDSYYQRATFFSKVSNQFVLNQNTPEASVKIVLNLGHQQKMIVQEGVFEQIQWSWCYYFPLAFVLGYFSVLLLNLMLKYGIIESRVRAH